MATLLITTVGWAVFFYWAADMWHDIDSGSCFEGWNLFYLINWLIILGFTFWSAILVTAAGLLVICCAPCLYKIFLDYQNDRRTA